MSTNRSDWVSFGVGLLVGASVVGVVLYRKWRKPTVDEDKIQIYSTRHTLNGIPFIVAEDVREYREIARKCLKETDVVIEIGCAGGVTTDIISECCADTVGIDLSERCIERAKKRFPETQFEVMGAEDISAIRKLRKYFNVIFLDVSGNRELQTIFPLLTKYEHALQPELIVIKNFKLVRAMNQCHFYAEYKKINIMRTSE